MGSAIASGLLRKEIIDPRIQQPKMPPLKPLFPQLLSISSSEFLSIIFDQSSTALDDYLNSLPYASRAKSH